VTHQVHVWLRFGPVCNRWFSQAVVDLIRTQQPVASRRHRDRYRTSSGLKRLPSRSGVSGSASGEPGEVQQRTQQVYVAASADWFSSTPTLSNRFSSLVFAKQELSKHVEFGSKRAGDVCSRCLSTCRTNSGCSTETSRNRAWCSDELAVHTLTVRDASISEAQLTTMARDALCLHAGYLVGLYGVQVSPLLLAVASLGIVCVLKPDAAKQTLRALQLQGIALTDLDSVEKRKPADFASPSWIIVCGSHAKDRSGRGIWVIFSPDRIILILVGSFRSDAETRSTLMRLRHESSVHGDGSLQTLGNALNQTEIIHAQDWKRGLRLLGLTLANRFPGGARPPLLFLQTAVPVALMRRRVPALNNYPLAVVPPRIDWLGGTSHAAHPAASDSAVRSAAAAFPTQ
jgi:hypothetical protein